MQLGSAMLQRSAAATATRIAPSSGGVGDVGAGLLGLAPLGDDADDAPAAKP